MRILIMDDDYISRSKLKLLLSEYGDCDVAPNGEIGLAMFISAYEETLPYSLITLDIHMPVLRGPDFIKKVREWEEKHSIKDDFRSKIIVITGQNFDKDVERTLDDGAFKNIVQKPITKENLKAVLDDLNIKELMEKNKLFNI